MRDSFLVRCSLAVILSFGPSAVFAVCTGADRAGNFRVYGLFGAEQVAAPNAFTRCLFRIGPTGAVLAGSSCTDNTNAVETVTGTITLSTSCLVTANLTVGGFPVRIVQGQMSRDKEHISGVGRFTFPGVGTAVFLFSAIRI